MRKITAVLIAVCLLCSFAPAALATALDGASPSGDTRISAVVPDHHTVTVNAENASVFFDGAAVESFPAGRLVQPKLLICPDENRVVTRVLLDGTDVTGEIVGGYYTMPLVCRDSTLQVETVAAPPPADDGNHILTGTITQNGSPLAGVTLELHSTPQQCVTDSEGKFRFENVGGGHHTLTAIRSGLVIGYTEFTMQNGGSASFERGSNGFFTLSAPNSTATLSLAFILSDEGALQVSDVKTVAQNPLSPQTGDSSTVVLWMALLFLSGGAILTHGITARRRKPGEH